MLKLALFFILINSSISFAKVIGEDTRAAVSKAYSVIGKFSHECTGVSVSENVVLTNAHCFYSCSYGGVEEELKESLYSPGINNYINIFAKSFQIKEIHIPEGYKNKCDYAYDYALVELKTENRSLENYQNLEESFFNLGKAKLVGYPGDKAGSRQFESHCEAHLRFDELERGLIAHSCDSYSGQSGSPIFDEDGQIIGLHIGSDNLFGDNMAINFDETFLDFYHQHL